MHYQWKRRAGMGIIDNGLKKEYRNVQVKERKGRWKIFMKLP